MNEVLSGLGINKSILLNIMVNASNDIYRGCVHVIFCLSYGVIIFVETPCLLLSFDQFLYTSEKEENV